MKPNVFLFPFVAALCLALPLSASGAADSVVVFNEINYHPANEVTETEWVEFRSLQGVDVDISGWRIEGGIDFLFPAGTIIRGRSLLVVAANPAHSSLAGLGALGPFTGQLDNGGEELRLVNNSNRVMDRVSYSDGGDWPVGPDGSGATLVKADQDSADAGPNHWTTSPRVGGSPGVVNFPVAGDPPTVTTPIALNATWKYLDTNVGPPATWRDIAFDDSQWQSGGALLYAGNPNITGAGEGLLGYWPLEEASGTTAPNAVAGGNAAALVNGPTWVNDAQRGPVLSFNGTNQYANAGSTTIPQMTLTNDFTWSFWAYSSDTPNTDIMVGSRYNPAGGEFNPREFIKFTTSRFEFHRSATPEDIDYVDVPLNSWIHHAVVKQGASLTYYRNGAAAGTRLITQGLNNRQPLYFGGEKIDEYWNGKLDDVAIWEKAVPASSISALASGTVTPLTAPTGSSGGTLTTQIALGPTAHYFRHAFTFNGAKERTTLALRHMLDDGAVVYLNGTEVLRVNIPDGAVTHNTNATNEVATTIFSQSVSIPSASLVRGANVLAVEVHQHATNPDMVFGVTLSASEQPAPERFPGERIIFNEISAASDPQFRIELLNTSAGPLDLTGYKLASSAGQMATLPAQTVPAGGVVTFTGAQLGFTPADGVRLFLFGADGLEFDDAREVTNKLRARTNDGEWGFASASSFGAAANSFTISSDVVINEIMYHPHVAQAAQEQWIELFNRGSTPVNLAGWQFDEAVQFTFPPGTTLVAGQYLVIADNPTSLATRFPGVTILGPFGGNLARGGERLQLRDLAGNLVDEVRYYDDGRWPELADGGGSSLERRNPFADSSLPEIWAASDESGRGQWRTVSYSGPGTNIGNDPTQWREFIFGVLAKGSFLIDDISVKETNAALGITDRELIQNGDFSSGAATFWRMLGTHRHATVVDDPDAAGNKVLRVDASGFTEHMHNHAETTLKSGATFVPITPASTYAISFRARWLGGSNLLHTRLYFNRLARKTALDVPAASGTPGAQNRSFLANLGPGYRRLTHAPAVPLAGQSATVSVMPSDPGGLGALTLFYAVDGGAFTSTPMSDPDQDGIFTGTIPGQSASAKVQFYVQAQDALGASAFFPAAGPASRAIVPWFDGQAGGGAAQNLRITMLTADANFLHTPAQVMSDDEIGATIIYRESEIYYDVGVRLKGSERGRNQTVRVGWHLRFPPHQPFLGAHETIAIDRSGAGNQFSQKEMLINHAIGHSGNIAGSYADLIRVIGTRTQLTGSAMLFKARFSDEFLENQFVNGTDGTTFEYELIYYPTTTTGGPEGLKVPEPDNVAGVGLTNLGVDPNLYRWHYLIKNNRQLDDYSKLIPALAALGQPAGAAYFTNTRALLDVDVWLRSFAVQVLFGIGDNYSSGAQHNALFYVRPSDGKLLYFPFDMDFTFSSGTTSSITPANDLAKLVGDGANRRAYYGHLLDIINTSFNTAYMTPWAQHYTSFLGGENLNQHLTYINTRANFVRSQINAGIPSVPFAVTTNGGQPFDVNTPFATVQGNGWVNVREIRLAGSAQPLAVTWTDTDSWQVSVPLGPGANTITLEAVGFDGAVLGSATIMITNTGTTQPASATNLVISEIMYHPALPSAPEQTAGFNYPGAEDEFEFVEVLNISASAVDLTNARFTDGLEFTFSARVLAPGERLVIARNLTAFAVRYPGVPSSLLLGPFASGRLSDSSETITLLGAGGAVIRTVRYDESTPWPSSADGAGPSLVLRRPAINPDAALPQNWRHSAQMNGNPGSGDEQTLAAWKTANGITDEMEDLDRDGLTNFMEYFHGTSATLSDGARIWSSGSEDGHLVLEFTRRIGADDLSVTPQTSTDLVTWSSDAALFPYEGVVFNTDGTETVSYRLAPAISAEQRRFVRLQVSQ